MTTVILAGLLATQAGSATYPVQPYYLYPADQPYHKAYEEAANKIAKEIQDWYKERVGTTFRLKPLIVKQSKLSYAQMRGGANPSEEVLADKQKMPRWWEGVEQSVGGWKDREVTWVFAQGGGGYAAANLIRTYAGIGMFGDWVLEPISGVREPAAITADLATWQVQGGVPMGTTAHELGHAFGLHHPDDYPGKSIMRWHGDYPKTDLLDHELLILRNSPYFVPNAYSAQAPWVDFENEDKMVWDTIVRVRGRGFKEGDELEFVDVKKTIVTRPMVIEPGAVTVRVPKEIGPGFIRARRGDLKGNAVPVNFYPK